MRWLCGSPEVMEVARRHQAVAAVVARPRHHEHPRVCAAVSVKTSIQLLSAKQVCRWGVLCNAAVAARLWRPLDRSSPDGVLGGSG